MSRPRAFDTDEAIDRALELFWRKGYEGTSLTDLTASMGINRPSLYAAFGSKEGLFKRALDRYVESQAGPALQALEAPTARGGVERLLRFYADAAGMPDRPRGCLLVQGALACNEESDAVRLELAARRALGETLLRDRLKRAKAEGELPADVNPADLARYIWAVLHGMTVQSAGGATREELRRVATQAMRAWPTER